MTMITFYSVSADEEARFTELLQGTDQTYELKREALSLQHSNADAVVISIFASDSVTAEVMDSMPNLKLIATRTTGYDHIDLAAAKERNITVVNVPAYGEETVAEFAFALLLTLSRKIREATAAVATAEVDNSTLRGFDLSGKTFGVVGCGRIGQHAARIAKGFGMNVVAYDPFPNQEKAQEIGFNFVELPELMQQSDIISVHAPLTKDNHHLINADMLAHTKPTAVLVNTARGELIDTTAVVQALGHKKLAGAALDVLEFESLLQRDKVVAASGQQVSADEAQAVLDILSLKSMPQVLLTPHNAFNTLEAVDRIRVTTIQNITDYLKGQTPNKIEA
jgi:D-lactate dehydrogenase